MSAAPAIPPLVLIGAGRLGRTLGLRLAERNLTVRLILSRDEARAQALGEALQAPSSTSLNDVPPDVRLIVCCVSDDAITPLAEQLAALPVEWPACHVAHTSGARPAHALAPLQKRGASCFSFHPLQSFTPSSSPQAFEGVFVGLEGSDSGVEMGVELARRLGCRPLELPAGGKDRYHLAAVIASNFLVTLMEAARQALENLHLPDANLTILKPLIEETWQNTLEQGPAQALTGPIARADWTTISRHLDTLTALPDSVQAVYHAMGRQTIQLALETGRISAEEAAQGHALFRKATPAAQLPPEEQAE